MGTITTTGRWQRVSVDDLQGLTIQNTDDNRSEIRWGEPVGGGGQSGYDFEGYTADAALDGTDFLLGKYTHHNQVITLNHWQFWVFLEVDVHFDDDDIDHTFVVRFRHDETPNQGDHPNDRVKLPTINENDSVYVNGSEYKVTITGFWRRRVKTTFFDIAEGGSASAEIFAKLELVEAPTS
jgi:hypothetical protein